MKLSVIVETKILSPLTVYEGIIRVVFNGRSKEFFFGYSNPFPAECRDALFSNDDFEIVGRVDLPENVLLELQMKVYLSLTDEDSIRDGNKIFSEVKEKNTVLCDIPGLALA